MTGTIDDLVSVIIPAFNAERWIGATLASALAQTYRNLEVIVVDDGSTDKTLALVEEFAACDSRVRVVHQENRGQAAARNVGVAASKGSFIAPLDADDLWHPEKLEKQIAVMRAGGQKMGLVYCWCSIIDEAGRVVARGARLRDEGKVFASLLIRCFIPSGSIPLIDRSCLVESGGYDVRYREGCEDWKLYLLIAENYQFGLVPEFLVGYRRTSTMWSNHISRMKCGHESLWKDMRQRHPELGHLFRRSQSEFCYRYGVRSLKNGDIRQGLALLASSMLKDPFFPTRPLFRQGIAGAARKVGRRFGFVENYMGRPFLEVRPGE